jgi:hypothetical protein
MKTEQEIREAIETTFIKIEPNEKLKAYWVSDKDCEADEQIIVWAKSPGEAKSLAMCADCFDGFDFTDLRVERQKEFDRYWNAERIPIKKLLNLGWWFGCCKCGCGQIYEDNIEAKEAFIIDTENSCNFAKGAVICGKCYKELNL